MAKHRGRGFATIEYPTGMNQNGDPSQAWIKLKPDGRVDVFAGTVDIGQGSKTVHTQIVADALGVPYDWVTMDNSNTDSSAVCTGTFASRGTFIGGNAVRYAAEKTRERILDIASKEIEIAPDDLEIVDGEVLAKGAPDRKISVADVAGAATYAYGELITGSGAALKPLAEVDDDDGSVTIEPHSAISYAACVIDVEVDDETGEVDRAQDAPGLRRRPRDQPDDGRGPDRGRRDDGPRARAARGVLSLLPGGRAPRRAVRLLPGAGDRRPARVRQRDPREPVGRRRRSAPRRSARWPTTRSRRRSRPPSTTPSASGSPQMPATPERVLRALDAKREPRREGKRVIFDEEISVAGVSADGGRGVLGRRCLTRASAPGTASSRTSSSTACACTRSAASRCCCAGSSTSRASRCRATPTSTPSS